MAEGREQHTEHVGLSSAEEENVVRYRPVSRAAVVSLVLGVLSFTAVFNPVMWCVPIAGVTLAVVALVSIRREAVVAIGRRAAQFGLGLGLVFLSFAVTRDFARQQVLYRQARPHTRQWIELVREGRLDEAFQLHLPRKQRRFPGEDLQTYYESRETAKREMKAFFETPPLSKIVELGRRGTLRFVKDEKLQVLHEEGEKVDVVIQRYAIDYSAEGKPQTLPFLVAISRSCDLDDGVANWQVGDVNEAPSAGL